MSALADDFTYHPDMDWFKKQQMNEAPRESPKTGQ